MQTKTESYSYIFQVTPALKWHFDGKAVVLDTDHFNDRICQTLPDLFGQHKLHNVQRLLRKYGFKHVTISHKKWKTYVFLFIIDHFI